MFYIHLEVYMRTLIDIQDELMAELLKEARTSVKKEAIILAIKTFINVKRRERLASLVGNYEFGYTLEDLDEMRRNG
jgi:Arc/MetJ family transcription regulator